MGGGCGHYGPPVRYPVAKADRPATEGQRQLDEAIDLQVAPATKPPHPGDDGDKKRELSKP